ncbi:MAG: hypothetical protein ABI040_09520 [Rhodoferax sp.]
MFHIVLHPGRPEGGLNQTFCVGQKTWRKSSSTAADSPLKPLIGQRLLVFAAAGGRKISENSDIHFEIP